jgi:sulfate adenylyltransferase large subunit
VRVATKDVLRLATIGSVDDGKSTLIGRLLVDTRQLFDDQLDAVVAASERRGVGDLDLSFVTDGLRAEREQGITIDVAYRYAATPTRKFIIADCPGHVQYTRNMATGASTADLALVALDVASGLKEQTRRHLVIAALLGVRAVVVAVNKMDTVDWSSLAFGRVVDEIDTLSGELGFHSTVVIPVSALYGDNVVEPSTRSPWYGGPTVLDALEASEAGTWESARGARLPVQWVLRQVGGGRTYAGMVSGETLRVGDRVTVLPAGVETTVRAINYGGEARTEAAVGLAADLDLEHETDAGRGDMIATEPLPRVTRDLDATVCWFGEQPLTLSGRRLRLKHTTRSTPVRVRSIDGLVDVGTLSITPADSVATNEIGLVSLVTGDALVVDEYRDDRVTGSFVLIDEVTHATVAAGMVGHPDFL